MAHRSMRTPVRVGITTLALTLAACGGGGGSSDGTEAPDPATAALSQAANCEELLESIRADAREKIRLQGENLRASGWSYVADGLHSPQGSPTPRPAATPPPPGGPPRGATDTNTQVPGVDEADVVEIAGDRIYLLRNAELVAITASPAEAMALGERIPIEGFPLGMFVANGRGLVASLVWDDGSLGGDSRCGAIGPPFPTLVVGNCAAPFVKLTLLDLAATPARVARELYVEGTYVGARRHDMRARLIVQRSWGAPPDVSDPWGVLAAHGPHHDITEFLGSVDAWETAALAAIEASTLDQWLPMVRERSGGALIDHPLDCTDVLVAPPGHTQHGATLVLGMDLAGDEAALEDTTLLGLSSQIYASGDTLVLAHPEWQAAPFGEATTRTALHVFGLPAGALATEYHGSGFVPGTVLSQFSMDVRDDVVRVATSYQRAPEQRTVTRVHTARLRDGALEILGATGDIAPGESLQSVRFLGDRAYVVTFLVVDPLFVVDLHDPEHPTVLGEVEIPGFSRYLHPLDERHLLTIGPDGRGDVALQIFDVGEPTAPRRVHVHTLPDAYSSPAEWNHLAFTYDRRLGLLALPLNSSGSWFWSAAEPMLQLFTIDPAAGIELRGTVRHDPPRSIPCPPPFEWEGCRTHETMERGLFIDDVLYSIGNHEMRAQRLDDLAVPLARITLP